MAAVIKEKTTILFGTTIAIFQRYPTTKSR